MWLVSLELRVSGVLGGMGVLEKSNFEGKNRFSLCIYWLRCYEIYG
jgi:hypothetical protein